ncbi:MAG: HupE/UreJ family protein [Devosiaceae bacterium]|nr:HupE/UreJ family protein [Devosiaceae bacterium]
MVGTLALVWGSIAHEVQPAIADLSFLENGKYSVSILLNLEAVIAGIEPDNDDTSQSENAPEYDRMRSFSDEELKVVFEDFQEEFLGGLRLKADGVALGARIQDIQIPETGDIDLARETTLVISGDLPVNAKTFTWGWAFQFGSSVIRIAAEEDNEAYSAYIVEGQLSDPLPITGSRARGFLDTVTNYIRVGYIHIVPRGIDHILFVVGLFLLSTRLHPLLWQITAFTVAHTISLALGILGLVVVSPAIVEPLIALSIVYVSVENIFTQKLTRWRPFVVFAFGLLHGLGFAGVLSEIGLPDNQFAVGLISFNIGVELGQLSVIAVCFLLVGFWFSKTSWYHKFIVIPASLAIGAVAIWWFIERMFFV